MPSILVVDDSTFLRKRVREALQEKYTIQEAGNGSLALGALEKEEFACVVTDLVMPVMDGFGFLEEMQKRGIHLPVVVLTADIQKTTRARCEELGVQAVMTKPVNLLELRAAVAQAVKGNGPQ